jgi:tRNA nucleotidyltransferase (CCA-adding enzyme)
MDAELEVYLVGGAVRDVLLGREVGDRDWVVVGSTPEQMQRLGFTPVGRDFPVYLHPHSHEEYALARTERKQGRGHRGFDVHAEPTVTLEEDLRRRDLTINAIAQDADGKLIDPFGGEQDLRQKTLRHISAAFAEDPLRVFRVARFAALLPDFTVATETLELMRAMAAAGELRELSAERVWQELHKALAAAAPLRFFSVLADSACLADWFADIATAEIRFQADDALLRFAELPLDAPGFKRFAGRLKAPNEFLQTALDWVTWRGTLSHWQTVDAHRLSEALKALQVAHDQKRLQRMTGLLIAGGEQSTAQLLRLADEWRRVKVDGKHLSGPAYGEALMAARVAFLEQTR